MSSISNDRNGTKRVQFVFEGKRHTIYMGKVSKAQADAFATKVDQLVATSITGTVDHEAARWLIHLNDDLHAKLAKTGLIPSRQSALLKDWINTHVEERKTDRKLKLTSWRKLAWTRDLLLEHFKADLPLRKMTRQHGTEWRKFLDGRLSVASAKNCSGNAKSIFAAAVEAKLIVENPFAHLQGGRTKSKYAFYVTPEMIAKVIENCPNIRWKMLFGLTRYAGLRTPSETHELTWQDVNWDKARLTVRSCKTEAHEGKDKRFVPIVPALMALLEEGFASAPEGDSQIVNITGQGNMARWIKKITEAAGVPLWEKVWQTLRKSCEIQWAMSEPQNAVSYWMGHSMLVSEQNYLHVPDELFDRVAQKAAHVIAAPSGVERNDERAILDTAQISGVERHTEEPCDWRRWESNPPLHAENPANHAFLNGTAQITAHDDSRLARIVDAWPNLPEHIKLEIERIVLQ